MIKMKIRIYASLIILLILNSVNAQNTIKREIKYSNGVMRFEVISKDSRATFETNSDYTWEAPNGKVKTTSGFAAGNLLHNEYIFYNENYDVRIRKIYDRGIPVESYVYSDKGELLVKSLFDENGSNTYQYEVHKDSLKPYILEVSDGLYSLDNTTKFYTYPEKSLYLKKEPAGAGYPYFAKKISYFNEDGSSEIFYRLLSYVGHNGKDLESFKLGKYMEYSKQGELSILGNYSIEFPYSLKEGYWEYFDEKGESSSSVHYRIRVVEDSSNNTKTIYSEKSRDESTYTTVRTVVYSNESRSLIKY